MAGYSKWSKAKHINGPLDAKCGAVPGKLVKKITVAARLGDGGRSGNSRLLSAVKIAPVAAQVPNQR